MVELTMIDMTYVGDYTFMGPQGNSVIDYMVASPTLFERIANFKVGHKFPESDHLPQEAVLRINTGAVIMNSKMII